MEIGGRGGEGFIGDGRWFKVVVVVVGVVERRKEEERGIKGERNN